MPKQVQLWTVVCTDLHSVNGLFLDVVSAWSYAKWRTTESGSGCFYIPIPANLPLEAVEQQVKPSPDKEAKDWWEAQRAKAYL